VATRTRNFTRDDRSMSATIDLCTRVFGRKLWLTNAELDMHNFDPDGLRWPLIGKSNRYQRPDARLPVRSGPTFAVSLQHTTTCGDPRLRQPASDRTWLASFRGSVWSSGAGRDPWQSRRRLSKLHDPEGTKVVIEHSQQSGWGDDPVIHAGRSSIDGSKTSPSYDQYRYVQLLATSVFCLAPRGAGLHSYRIAEATGCGCIPVILDHELSMPFEAELNDLCSSPRSVLLDQAPVDEGSDQVKNRSDVQGNEHHMDLDAACPRTLRWWQPASEWMVRVEFGVSPKGACVATQWEAREHASAAKRQPKIYNRSGKGVVLVTLGAYYVRISAD